MQTEIRTITRKCKSSTLDKYHFLFLWNITSSRNVSCATAKQWEFIYLLVMFDEKVHSFLFLSSFHWKNQIFRARYPVSASLSVDYCNWRYLHAKEIQLRSHTLQKLTSCLKHVQYLHMGQISRILWRTEVLIVNTYLATDYFP